MGRSLESFRNAVSSITVEPVLFLFMIGSSLEYTAFLSLLYAKVCEEKYSPYVCDNLNSDDHKSELDDVQSSSSYLLLWSNVALGVSSMFSALYIGTWSDIFGRKMPILFPPLGQILCALLFMAVSADSSMSASWIVVANLVAGLLGGYASGILTLMSYLAAITAAGQRTLRVGLLESMTFLGSFVGPFVGTLVSENAGRTWTFCTLVIINAAIVVYVVVRLPEVPPSRPLPAATSTAAKLARVFSLRYLWEAVRTALRPRQGNRRVYILTLLVSALVIFLNSSGEGDVTFLYVKDAPLALGDDVYNVYYSFHKAMGGVALLRENDVTYLFFKDKPLAVSDRLYYAYFSVKFGCGGLALLVGLPVLRKLLQPSDLALTALGITSKLLGLIWLAFAVNKPMLFIAPVVAMFNTLCIPPIRSLLSKLVDDNEQGRIFSLVTVVESLCTFLGSLVYNGVYPATRHVLHGMVFLVGAATLLVPAAALGLLQRDLKRTGQLHTLHPPPPPPDATEELGHPPGGGEEEEPPQA